MVRHSLRNALNDGKYCEDVEVLFLKGGGLEPSRSCSCGLLLRSRKEGSYSWSFVATVESSVIMYS